jgi:sterol desaturase/sphingolipid hydroxylase (fatty acid hydroxylase superfamily)
MDLNDLLIVGALALIFAPLEHLLPAGPRDWSPRRLTTDMLHLLIGGAAIRWGMFGVTLALGVVLNGLLPAGWSAAVRRQPDWLEFIELLLLSDLGFYAAHRLVHSVPWLWRFHEVHHSSEHLDWLATYRVHPVDQVINSSIITLPLMVLGFSPVVVLIYAMAYRAHAILLHSNLKVSFGPLKWLVASPHYHHWHHANEPDAYDKNFGGQLVVFDWLFGTLNMPIRQPAAFGIAERVSPTFLGQLAHPFHRTLAASPKESA